MVICASSWESNTNKNIVIKWNITVSDNNSSCRAPCFRFTQICSISLVQFGSEVAVGRRDGLVLQPDLTAILQMLQFVSLSLSQRSSVPSSYGRWGSCPSSHNLCNAKIERVRAAHLTPQPEPLKLKCCLKSTKNNTQILQYSSAELSPIC